MPPTNAQPAEPSSVGRARCNGVELAYEVFGDQGEPILLVMGFAAQLLWWPGVLCRDLADRGFVVIRFDNRDIGESTRLVGQHPPPFNKALIAALLRGLPGVKVPAPPYTISDMARDATALLDHLGFPQAHLCGASMGGLICQRIAMDQPQRVKSLALIMAPTASRRDGLPTSAALRTLLQKPPRNKEEAGEALVKAFSVLGSPGFENADDYFRDLGERCFVRSAGRPLGAGRHLAAILAEPSHRAALRKIRAPTLVVHGDRDPLVRPRAGRGAAEAIPGAELMMIPGMGHDLPRAIWPQLADALEKLARRATS